MSDTYTIDQIPRTKTTLTGTDLFEGMDAQGSFQSSVDAIRALPSFGTTLLTADPAVTSGTTPVMVGQGNPPYDWLFTPATSGQMLIIVTGTILQQVSAKEASGLKVFLYYGTGVPPAPNAALTGTSLSSGVIGGVDAVQGPTAQDARPFTLAAFVPGLVPGTQYWVDLAAQQLLATGDASVTGVNITIVEL